MCAGPPRVQYPSWVLGVCVYQTSASGDVFQWWSNTDNGTPLGFFKMCGDSCTRPNCNGVIHTPYHTWDVRWFMEVWKRCGVKTGETPAYAIVKYVGVDRGGKWVRSILLDPVAQWYFWNGEFVFLHEHETSSGQWKCENGVVFYINDIDTDSNVIYQIICICICIYGCFQK